MHLNSGAAGEVRVGRRHADKGLRDTGLHREIPALRWQSQVDRENDRYSCSTPPVNPDAELREGANDMSAVVCRY